MICYFLDMIIGIDASRAVTPKWAGPENYSYFLTKKLVSCDNKNSYRLYTNRPFPRKIEYPFNNVEEVIINWPRFWTQGGLALECWRRAPEVLFIPAHTLPVIRKKNLPTVVTIHDLGVEYLENFHKFPERLYLNRSTEYCARHADQIIAVSNSTKNDLVSKLKVPEKKITVIYEGYEKEVFYPSHFEGIKTVRKKYDINVSQYFLSVGTVQPRKNYEGLIQAFAQFLKLVSEPNDISLVIVGKKGWLDKKIFSLPKELGINALVKFLGHIPDEELAPLYSGALAFVFPSFYEGFGLVVLEAMACGTPVITSHVSSLPEVVRKAGILVNPYRVETISTAMKRIFKDLDLRQSLIEKGFLQAKKFSWEKCARETLKVLEKVFQEQTDQQ